MDRKEDGGKNVEPLGGRRGGVLKREKDHRLGGWGTCGELPSQQCVRPPSLGHTVRKRPYVPASKLYSSREEGDTQEGHVLQTFAGKLLVTVTASSARTFHRAAPGLLLHVDSLVLAPSPGPTSAVFTGASLAPGRIYCT